MHGRPTPLASAQHESPDRVAHHEPTLSLDSARGGLIRGGFDVGAGQLDGMRVAFAVANEGVEQVELTVPWDAVVGAGGQPVLVSGKPGTVQAFNHLDKGEEFPVDKTFEQVSVGDFDALVLPGGVANPDALRMDATAVGFVKSFFEADKPVAAICHAPWMLVEAGVLEGRTLTSWPSLRTDITNAGGTWRDDEVVRDGILVTSRKPDDLPAFNEAMVTLFAGTQSHADERAS